MTLSNLSEDRLGSGEERLRECGWVELGNGRWLSPYTRHSYYPEDALRIQAVIDGRDEE